MKISGNYATHLAPLIVAIGKTKGDVLELGVGFFSTPYLHYQCLLSKRRLVSMDNDKHWLKKFAVLDFNAFHYQGPYHEFRHINDWTKADIEKPWDVVLVDHSPGSRRIEEVKRLANLAKYIIIHDSNPAFESEYHYSQIYPLFKYRSDWTTDARHATILSNLIDLKDFWK